MTDINSVSSVVSSFPTRPLASSAQVANPGRVQELNAPDRGNSNTALSSPTTASVASPTFDNPVQSQQQSRLSQSVQQSPQSERAELNNTRQTPVDDVNIARQAQLSRPEVSDRPIQSPEQPVPESLIPERAELPDPSIATQPQPEPQNDAGSNQFVTSPLETVNANTALAPTAPEPINPPEANTSPAPAGAGSEVNELATDNDEQQLREQVEAVTSLQQELQSRFDAGRAGGPPEPNIDALV